MSTNGPKILPMTDAALATAADEIVHGRLVAFPTETVYGLGADATSESAIARIFEAKKRPRFNPLIIHVADAKQAEKYVEFDARAKLVAESFWPGPISMVLKRKPGCAISLLAGAGLETLAIRAPDHKAAQALLQKCGVPLAAPSANRSGQVSPTTPQHVAESLSDVNDLSILAGGKCTVGLESTVLDLTGETPAILRHGAVTAEDLEPLIGPVTLPGADTGTDAPKSPGQTLRHYAPDLPIRLNAVDVAPDEALLAFGKTKFMGLRGGGFANDLPDERLQNLSPVGDLNEAAANLFAMLRRLDDSGAAGIAVMAVPETGLGLAINDRLKRAAAAQNQPAPLDQEATRG